MMSAIEGDLIIHMSLFRDRSISHACLHMLIYSLGEFHDDLMDIPHLIDRYTTGPHKVKPKKVYDWIKEAIEAGYLRNIRHCSPRKSSKLIRCLGTHADLTKTQLEALGSSFEQNRSTAQIDQDNATKEL